MTSSAKIPTRQRMHGAFLRGMGSVLEIFSVRHYPPGTLRRSDAENLKADFDAVAGDMQRAMGLVKQPTKGKNKKPTP